MSDELVDWSRELLAPLGVVRSRRLFGGHGLYVDDLFIALIFQQTLFLKVDLPTRTRFEQAGCHPFVFTSGQGERTALSYFSAPEEAMDSPAQMLPWARLAMASALRARASKPPAKRRAAAAPATAKRTRQSRAGAKSKG
jgi:DNA transformation protein and related proteins